MTNIVDHFSPLFSRSAQTDFPPSSSPSSFSSSSLWLSSNNSVSSSSSSSSSSSPTVSSLLEETMVASLAPTELSADNAATLRVVRYIVQKVCVPVVVALGVLGNSLSMVVLTRKSMKNSTSCYLTALAAFDMVYLVCSLTLSFKHYDLIHRNAVYVHWFPYGRVLSDMAANVSVLLTVTFTVERYIGVCHPIKGRLLCTPQRAQVVIALVVVMAAACTLPEVFEMEVVWKTDHTATSVTATTVTTNSSNSSSSGGGGGLNSVIAYNDSGGSCRYPTTQYTTFASTFSYQIGYYWFIASLFTFLPLLLLCVFNGLLVASLFRAAQRRTRMTSVSSRPGSSRSTASPTRLTERCSREQHWITKMLVTVVVVFILCQLPGAILLLLWAYKDLAQVNLSAHGKNQFHMAANVTNLLLQINASINFLLYSVSSSKFRRVFCRTLCLLRPGVQPSALHLHHHHLHHSSSLSNKALPLTAAATFRGNLGRWSRNEYHGAGYSSHRMLEEEKRGQLRLLQQRSRKGGYA